MSSTPARAGQRAGRHARIATAVLLLTSPLVGPDAAHGTPRPLADAALEVRAGGCSGLVPRHGSAVALGRHLVATMAHVVAGSNDIVVAEPDGTAHAAEIVAIDTRRDAAVLRVPGLERRVTTFGTLAPGEPAHYYGFGGDRPRPDVRVTVERVVSIVSEDIYIEGSYPRPGYELSGNVLAGDSGAGVVSVRGSLAGLVWAASRGDDGRAFAVSTAVLSDLLSTVGPDRAPAVACP